jgi:hypothetical protein
MRGGVLLLHPKSREILLEAFLSSDTHTPDHSIKTPASYVSACRMDKVPGWEHKNLWRRGEGERHEEMGLIEPQARMATLIRRKGGRASPCVMAKPDLFLLFVLLHPDHEREALRPERNPVRHHRDRH